MSDKDSKKGDFMMGVEPTTELPSTITNMLTASDPEVNMEIRESKE